MSLDVSSSNKQKGLRNVLKKIAPTWFSTPGRRLAQTFCLLLFLALFFYLCRPYINDYSSENPGQLSLVELFLILDPLVSISTAIASKALIWSLGVAVVVLLIGMVYPRWFCGYVCPMGTLIDLFDWSIGNRIKRFRIKRRGWWVNLRFYILAFVLISSVFGVLISGFVAAIPVVTRGMMYIFAPLQLGLAGGWDAIPPMNTAQYISIFLFLIILGFGFLRPRFWCAYVCPSGALISLASILRLTERKVENSCIECGRCHRVCPFDAIAPDFSTRSIDCTICRGCEDVCPKKSIKFVSRWNNVNTKSSSAEPAVVPSYSRRGFLFGLIGAAGAGAGAATGLSFEQSSFIESYPVRPPGSLPEDKFRRQCVRCGECLKVCPGNVLQPAGFELGIDGIWTPKVNANFSGCKPYCNNCGQVCPTGAIRELPIEEKRAARIGLAEINTNICLPHSFTENCGLCAEECTAAGYNAIEFMRVGIEYDEQGMPIPDSGFLAPVMIEDKCVGCGLCQARCYARNVKELNLLEQSAIVVTAGPDKEDRITKGSYLTLKQQRQEAKKQQSPAPKSDYLPDFLR